MFISAATCLVFGRMIEALPGLFERIEFDDHQALGLRPAAFENLDPPPRTVAAAILRNRRLRQRLPRRRADR
jgi:hypothetical protein